MHRLTKENQININRERRILLDANNLETDKQTADITKSFNVNNEELLK